MVDSKHNGTRSLKSVPVLKSRTFSFCHRSISVCSPCDDHYRFPLPWKHPRCNTMHLPTGNLFLIGRRRQAPEYLPSAVNTTRRQKLTTNRSSQNLIWKKTKTSFVQTNIDGSQVLEKIIPTKMRFRFYFGTVCGTFSSYSK